MINEMTEDSSKKVINFEVIVQLCRLSKVGKILPNALYVHSLALQSIYPVLQNYENRASQITNETQGATLVKFNFDRPKISYLFYPDFDTNPHPTLERSVIVDTENLTYSCREYKNTQNPPILHRKETFITPDYPRYEDFAHLTHCETVLGLLDKSHLIGNLHEWQNILSQQNIDFQDHYLICPLNPDYTQKRTLKIDRHKAALKRNELSRPVKTALEFNIITSESTFFDYGCGYGSDVKYLQEKVIEADGWDPYYQPDNPKQSADIVNLGYIINVIEDLSERREALIQAWQLTNKVLIVAAQVLIDDRRRGLMVYSDGIITNRNTFQKYYEQEELKIYIEQVLQVEAIPAGLGIYFVFRNEEEKEIFRASRFHSRIYTPRILDRNFEDYQVMLTPLMDFFSRRGRLPVKGELPEEQNIKSEFRSFRQAFKLILKSTNPEEWEAIAHKRRDELLIYLALSKFSGRPTMRKLPHQVKEDIKALFNSYNEACLLADMMLFSLRDIENIADYCAESPVGQRRKNSFWVHISALETLDPMLRLYEGCASRAIGRLEQANVIKFSLKYPKISYLYYPNFDTEAHPCLYTSMQINLTELRVTYQDFDNEDNPPILHQKDKLVSLNYPLYDNFYKITEQEKKLGLLDNYKDIARLQSWLQCLKNNHITIKGHKISYRKDADSEKIKIIKSILKENKIQKNNDE